jgi:hypothetical protein
MTCLLSCLRQYDGPLYLLSVFEYRRLIQGSFGYSFLNWNLSLKFLGLQPDQSRSRQKKREPGQARQQHSFQVFLSAELLKSERGIDGQGDSWRLSSNVLRHTSCASIYAQRTSAAPFGTTCLHARYVLLHSAPSLHWMKMKNREPVLDCCYSWARRDGLMRFWLAGSDSHLQL